MLQMTEQMPTSELKISLWNSAGLSNKFAELHQFIADKDIDVMLISETHLIDSDSIKIQGYSAYTANHPSNRRRGGVAVVIKNSIRHYALHIPPTARCQCAVVSLNLLPSKTINIASVYCPPQQRWSDSDFHELFLSLGDAYIIGGDWNARSQWWGNSRSCIRGRSLLNYVHMENLSILATGSPTHFPYNPRHSPSAIDFAIYKGIRRELLQIEDSHHLSSDHLPLIIYYREAPAVNTINSHLLKLNANIKTFQKYLDDHVILNTEIRCAADLDHAVDILERNICEAASRANPIPVPFNRHTSRKAFHIDRQTLQMIELRKLIKKYLLRNRNLHAKSICCWLSNRIRSELKACKIKFEEKLFSSIDPTDRYAMQKLWKLTNNFKRQPAPNLPLIKSSSDARPADRVWCKSTAEKAEAFALHLEERFSPILTVSQTDLVEIETGLRQTAQTDEVSFRPVRVSEVASIIKKLENKKAAGIDKVDNHTIKSLPLKGLLYLTLIYNNSLRLGHFPSRWKQALVKMIHKPGKPTHIVSSYRPISLLSGLSKILEKIILSRMMELNSVVKIIPNHQFGFRKSHSAEQQLGRVTKLILQAFEAGSYCSAVYMDIKEAFDRVWHTGLRYKLKKILPMPLMSILDSYLRERTFQVECHNGVRSDLKQINAGVPQGSILGPVLYNIYTSDIPATPLHTTHGYKTMVATYADDIIILISNLRQNIAITEQQRYLNTLEAWAKKWCITVNPAKSNHIMHTLRRVLPYEPVKLNNIPIKNVTKHVYLGVTLDSKLHFDQHISSLEAKIKIRSNKINWLINSHSKLPLKVKVILYKQLIAPIWQYTLPVWGTLLSNSQFARLKVMQSKILRLITGAPWHVSNETIRADLHVPTVEDIFVKACAKYYAHLRTHPNPEARNIANDPYVPQRLSRQRYSHIIQGHLADLIDARDQQRQNAHRDFAANFLTGRNLPTYGPISWLEHQRNTDALNRAQNREPHIHDNDFVHVMLSTPNNNAHGVPDLILLPVQDDSMDSGHSPRLPVFSQIASIDLTGDSD